MALALEQPLLSAIIPAFNEAAHIRQLIEGYLHHAPEASDIWVADGGSTDGTREILEELSSHNPRIHWVDNSEKYVSFGFNKVFPQTRGKYVALLGAHAEYSSDYFKVAIEALENGEADAVGGVLKQTAQTRKGKAIAAAMSGKFGVGNTEFRTESKRMYVDSVAFAIYKRELFEELGLLDTELLRNQDDELHYRFNAAGKRILMIPEIFSEYYVRENFTALFRQYFQYGLFKPLVLKKINSSIRWRHIVPAMFVLYILSLPIAIYNILWLFPLLAYIILLGFYSIRDTKGLIFSWYKMVATIVLHLSYGIGFLLGLFKTTPTKN
jgi:glycosyltransferase involved in cell wall biosynthesis